MKIFILLVALIVPLCSSAQKQETYVALRFGHLDIGNFSARNYGGLELDIQFDNNIGVQYSLLVGENYFHMPLSPLGGIIVGLRVGVLDNNSQELRLGIGALLGILTALIPESISYNIALSNQLSISPYLSPLQFEYLKNKGAAQGSWNSGLGVGSRVHIYLNDQQFRLSPYFEYKIHYGSEVSMGETFGISTSMRI